MLIQDRNQIAEDEIGIKKCRGKDPKQGQCINLDTGRKAYHGHKLSILSATRGSTVIQWCARSGFQCA